MSDADFTPVRRCTSCAEEKQFSDFYKDSRGKYGLRSVCKLCLIKAGASEQRKAYKARWYKENRERILDGYKSSVAVKEYRREYRAKNSGKLAAQCKEWRAKMSPEEKKLRAAESDKRAAEWRANNPERAAQISRAGVQKRRSRLKGADGQYTSKDLRWLLKMQKNTCAVCRCKLPKDYHVDHIQPLAKGGSNDKTNLQILCPPCNLSKNARDPVEFMQSRGFLL